MYFQRDKELAERFFLKKPSEYNYLNQSGCVTLDGVDDAAKFDNLRLAFEVVQVSYKPGRIKAGRYSYAQILERHYSRGDVKGASPYCRNESAEML